MRFTLIHQERPITNTSSAEKRWHGGIEYGKAGMTEGILYFDRKELNRFDQRRLYAFRRIYWIEDK